jgi:hypothetical protein
MDMNNERLVIWFDELQLKDIPEVGGKNASLGEMRQNLQKNLLRSRLQKRLHQNRLLRISLRNN